MIKPNAELSQMGINTKAQPDSQKKKRQLHERSG